MYHIRYICILWLLSLIAKFSWAQPYELRILSAQDSIEIPGAQMRIRDSLGSIIFQGISNFNGIVRISQSLPAGVELEIQSAGYEHFSQKGLETLHTSQKTIRLIPQNRMLNQVVVTASFEGENSRESVYYTRVIDQEKITQMGAVSLRDVLTNELGIQLQQDNILGSGMKLQGIGGQNVKILIDGVPVIGRLDGGIDLSQINMLQVERIELIEGPLSVQYGSDALAGTINIITKKTIKGSWEYGGQTFYESVGQYNIDIHAGKRFGHHLIQVNGARYFFDGWSPGTDFWAYPHATPADSNRTHQWKPKEQYIWGANYRYVRNNWNFRLVYDGYREWMTNRGVPIKPYELRAFDDVYDTKRQTGSFHTDLKLNKNWKIKAMGSYAWYNRTKNTFFVDLTTLERDLAQNASLHDTTFYTQALSRGSAFHSPKSGKWSTELGYEVSNETMTGKRILDNQQQLFYADFFATTAWKPISSFVIKPGVRYGYHSAYQMIPVPSLHMSYLKNRWNIRASYARGFRAPSIKELHFEFIDINHNIIGNTNLNPEQSHNAQLSVHWQLEKPKWLTKWDMKFFYNDITDQISLQVKEGTQEYTYFNIDRTRTTGVTINGEFAINHLQVTAGIAWLAFHITQKSFSYPEFLHFPEFRTAATYSFPKQGLQFALFYKFTGEQPLYVTGETGTPDIRQTESFHLLDITASKMFWKNKLQVVVGAKNLLNVTQLTANGGGGVHSSGAGFTNVARGRSVFFSLRFNIVHYDKKS
jgi:outer membrane receptor for ferrienterochelin and colicins